MNTSAIRIVPFQIRTSQCRNKSLRAIGGNRPKDLTRDRGVKHLVGLVMCDNWPMRDLLQDDPTAFEAILDL
jgi:hypothetical protein